MVFQKEFIGGPLPGQGVYVFKEIILYKNKFLKKEKSEYCY